MPAVKRAMVILLMALLSPAAFPAGRTSFFPTGRTATGERDWGMVFNSDSLLLDLESYQAGLGLKIGLKNSTLRAMADVLLNTELNPFSLTLGVVWERHVLPGPLSLYWGPAVQMGFTTLLAEKTDADNWTRNITWEFLSAGLVAGIELFIFDFLSVFVEYGLSLNLGLDYVLTSVAGAVSSTRLFTYRMDLGMGNQGMFGIVFYFRKRRPQ